MEKSLDRKLAAIKADPGCREFILADAKDADMALGLGAAGLSPERHTGELRYKSLEEYRSQIRAVTKQGFVDIMLMSAINSYALTIQERIFDQSQVTPAVRANDTTDVHLARGSAYAKEPSRPFRSATLDHIQCGRMDCTPEERSQGANLGLYSVTFNNDLDHDQHTLEKFHEFRIEAERKGFRYFLEVFDPNVPGAVDDDKLPYYINDMITRMLAGVATPGRPLFLKMVYHGPKAVEELLNFDPSLVVGVLGGAGGTTLDAFKLLADAQASGVKAALFGRKINQAENQLAFVQFLRLIAEGVVKPIEAVKAYHAVLGRLGIRPVRSLEDDLKLQQTSMSYGGSSVSVVKPASTQAAGLNAAEKKGAVDRAGGCVCEHKSQKVLEPVKAATGCGCNAAGGSTLKASQDSSADQNGFPKLADGRPDFPKMTSDQRVAYHRRRLGLGF